MGHLRIWGMGRPKMLLQTCASSFQYVFRRLGEAMCQRGDVCRSGTCTKPNCFALFPRKPLPRESRLAIAGRSDKNYVSALRLVEEGHEPWALNEPMAPSPFAERAWFCFAHANPRPPAFPYIHFSAEPAEIRLIDQG